MTKNTVLFVGGDVGFGTSVGMVLEYDPKTKNSVWLAKRVISSLARQGSNLTGDIMGKLNNTYNVNGIEYTVDHKSNGEGVDDRNEYHFSPIHCVLMQHLLQNLNLKSTDDVNIISGMPISLFYNENNLPNEDNIGRKQTVLENTLVAPLYNAQPFPIKNLEIVPEGIGAYLDSLFDDKADYVQGMNEDDVISVIDIGDGTTDIATMSNLTNIYFDRTASKNIGVSDIKKEIRNILIRDYGVKGETDYRINKMLFEREYRVNGVDLTQEQILNILSEALKKVLPQLIAFIKKVLANPTGIDRILIVGGGASIYGEEIKRLFQQAVIVKEPQLANARGFAKFGLYNWRSENNI